MDRRRESRLRVDTVVTVTVLDGPKQPPMAGSVVDVSGSGLKLILPSPVPCGSAVKVEGDNMLLLGEVCRSEPARGTYDVGLALSHTLGSLAELERLNGALFGTIGIRARTA